MATAVGGIDKGWNKQFHWRGRADSPAGVFQENCSATRASRVDGDTSSERSVPQVQGAKSEVQREDAAIMQGV